MLALLILCNWMMIVSASPPPGNSMIPPTTKDCPLCGMNVTALRGLVGRLAREIVLKKGDGAETANDTEVNMGARKFQIDLGKLQEELSSLKRDNRRQGNTIKRLMVRANRQRKNIDYITSFFKRWKTLFKQLGVVFSETGNFSIPLKTTELLPPIPISNAKPTTTLTTTTAKAKYSEYAKDCHDVWSSSSHHFPGTYYLKIQPSAKGKNKVVRSFRVACKITKDGGWTLIQKRFDGSVDFFKTWSEYKNGFGKLETEFWLGNDHIHQITSQGKYKLRIEMESWEGGKYYAEYDSFGVGNESTHYKLQVAGYHGNAGDSLTMSWNNHNNMPFSTWDSDHDSRYYDNCAKSFKGAWWFRSCFESHLNGVYYKNGEHNNFFVRNGVMWNSVHIHSSLKSTVMMVKPNV